MLIDLNADCFEVLNLKHDRFTFLLNKMNIYCDLHERKGKDHCLFQCVKMGDRQESTQNIIYIKGLNVIVHSGIVTKNDKTNKKSI